MRGFLKFLNHVGKLKQVRRTGWVQRNVSDPEAVSGHMYRMAMIALVSEIPELDKDKCIKLCLVHDLAECIVGDIAPSDNVPKEKKRKMEEDAMIDLCGMIEDKEIGQELKELFEEYECQASNEAIFVKDLDRFEMILQAQEYEDAEKGAGTLQEFFDGVEGKFKTDVVKKMVHQLKVEREEKSERTAKVGHENV